MARYRKSSRRRTPIRSTKAYRRGMLQTAGITAVALAFFPQAYGMILEQVNKIKAMVGGGA